MGFTEEEKAELWDCVNIVQNLVLREWKNQLPVLEYLSDDAANSWLEEGVDKFDLLQGLKSKVKRL